MSYSRNPEPMGLDALEAIGKGLSFFNKHKTDVGVALSVAADPYLGEVICEVNRMSSMEATGRPGPKCPRTRATRAQIAKGVGLRHAATPLRIYVWHREYPWAIPAGLMALVGVFGYIGYRKGRESR